MQHNLVKAHALPKTFQKLTKLLLVALFCWVGGCGLFDDGYYLSYTEQKVAGGGIISDTTALLLITTYEYWGNDGHFGSGGGGEVRNNKNYLALADIRFEKIYWKKSINRGFGFTFIDSVMFFTEMSYYNSNRTYSIGYLAIVAIDEEFDKSDKIVVPKGKSLVLKGEAWEYAENVTIRPWHSGLVLANSKYAKGSNHYALIDTTAGTFERWAPSGEYEWVNSCADVKWSSIGGLCLKQIPDTTGFVLLKNGVDTLVVKYMLPMYLSPNSDPNPLTFNGNSIILRGKFYLVDEKFEVSKEPFRWLIDYNKKF